MPTLSLIARSEPGGLILPKGTQGQKQLSCQPSQGHLCRLPRASPFQPWFHFGTLRPASTLNMAGAPGLGGWPLTLRFPSSVTAASCPIPLGLSFPICESRLEIPRGRWPWPQSLGRGCCREKQADHTLPFPALQPWGCPLSSLENGGGVAVKGKGGEITCVLQGAGERSLGK